MSKEGEMTMESKNKLVALLLLIDELSAEEKETLLMCLHFLKDSGEQFDTLSHRTGN